VGINRPTPGDGKLGRLNCIHILCLETCGSLLRNGVLMGLVFL